ncbi:metal-dependent hydrolase [candidate division WWE3 bacterium]|uniref:Metal-dependent hydrolase n=1 Tax=candidate division WWE3 bacterium TaxID=2053526 RepID=A0A955EAX3_UNCKA|nr:metal-dependent hydrolase [candidate division WWE3 bacterium]
MFLDILFGILSAKIINMIGGEDLDLIILGLSIFFALLPDIDVPVELYSRKGKLGGKTETHHRQLTHYPIWYIPLVIAVTYYFGIFWGFLLAVNVFWHFLHDLNGTGWGIKLLGPFSKNNYKMFTNKDGTQNLRQLFIKWTPAELTDTMQKHGDPYWMKNIMFNPKSSTFWFEVAIPLLLLPVIVFLVLL